MMRLELPLPTRIFVLAFLILSSIVAVTMVVLSFVIKDGPPLFFALFLCFIVSMWWYLVSGTPYRIEYNGPDDIRFVMLRKTVRTSAMQIESFKAGFNDGFYVLRHREGKFRMIVKFTGLYLLLAAIKEHNPSFETRGI